MTLLIDADYIAYKSCAACEDEIDYGDDLIVVTSRFSDVLEMFQNQSDDKNKDMIRDFVRTNPHLMPDVISMLKDE